MHQRAAADIPDDAVRSIRPFEKLGVAAPIEVPPSSHAALHPDAQRVHRRPPKSGELTYGWVARDRLSSCRNSFLEPAFLIKRLRQSAQELMMQWIDRTKPHRSLKIRNSRAGFAEVVVCLRG